MTLFRAESLLAAEEFEACAEVAGALVDEPGDGNLQLQAQVHILLAKTRQGLGFSSKRPTRPGLQRTS